MAQIISLGGWDSVVQKKGGLTNAISCASN